jgi:hypothetical protein
MSKQDPSCRIVRKLMKNPAQHFGEAEKRLAPLLFHLIEDKEIFTRFA